MAVKRGIGAHYGLHDWLAQRATAVVMLIMGIALDVAVLVYWPTDFESWREMMRAEWVRVTAFLFVVALAWHAWIGVRDIFMDYLKNDAFRLMKHIGAIVWLAVCVVWAARILLFQG